MSTFKIGIIVFLIVVVAAVLASLLRRRAPLPPHLKPYFKDSVELDAFGKKRRSAIAKRRKELTDPASVEEAAEYLTLNDHNIANSTFERALQLVEANLKDSPGDYGQLLGEIYAFSKIYKNLEKAYYYYFIGLSQDGYLVGFRDLNNTPPHYGGPIGDFRNESQVSMLIDELGWDSIKQIDGKAREWLILNNFEFKEFLEINEPQQ